MLPSRFLGAIKQDALISLKGIKSISNDFQIYRDFLDLNEQRILLTALLKKLDSLESPRARRRRRELISGESKEKTSVMSLFGRDESYEFQGVSFSLHTIFSFLYRDISMG